MKQFSIVNIVSINIWRQSPAVAALLFNLSQAGNMAIVTEVEGIGPWVTSTYQLDDVKGRWPTASVVASAVDLEGRIAASGDNLEMDS